MNNKKHYKTLGVDPSATASDIKAAYHKLALKYHPDRNPHSKTAENIFKKINAAYEILKDPDTRAEYDQYINSRSQRNQYKDSYTEPDKPNNFWGLLSILYKPNNFWDLIGMLLMTSYLIYKLVKLILIIINHQNFLKVLPYLCGILTIGILSLLFYYFLASPFKRISLINKLKNIITITIALFLLFLIKFDDRSSQYSYSRSRYSQPISTHKPISLPRRAPLCIRR